MYKRIGVIAFFLLGLSMVGCGSSNGSSAGNINGTWNASLTNTDGTPAFVFSTMFTEVSGGGVNVTNFTFTSSGPCFAGDTTSQTGSFGLQGNFNGNVMGTFGMTITTAFPGAVTQNVLTLQGTVNGNIISGTWTLAGVTGCSGQGTFSINKT